MIEKIIPTDDTHWKSLRLKDVTSTEVSALFGLSPYTTKFELWHRKKEGVIVNIKENERMRWGTRLQNSIAKGIAEDSKWQIREMKEYIHDTETRIGSSFDFAIFESYVETPAKEYSDGKGHPDIYSFRDTAILEIKNVDSLAFRNGWEVDGDNLEAPPHIELQVQHQLALTGLPVAYIGALVGGNDVKLIKRERDEAVIKKILEAVSSFWKSIENNSPPPPEFEKDADFISKLYSFAEPGKVVDASKYIATLAQEYKEASDMAKEYTSKRDAAKAEMLTIIGDAEKCRGENFTISAGVVGPASVSYEREGYRTFKINWKKVK